MDEQTVIPPERDDSASVLRGELLEIVREEIGMVDGFAEMFADALLRGMRARMGGREVYIPAPDKSDRDAQIRAMFNGRNLTEVMRRFGVCRSVVYRAAGGK